MKIHTDCVPCLLKRTIFETNLCTSDTLLKQRIMKEALTILQQQYSPNHVSAIVATKLHSRIYELLENDDPYSSLKKKSNEVALSMESDINSLIEESDDPLMASMLCAIIGNMMDFGIEGASNHPEDLLDIFRTIYEKGFAYSDYHRIIPLLSTAKNMLYFTDNSGEIVFDKLLCQQLKQQFPQLTITLVVKETPVLSDATVEDANMVSISTIVDEIKTTGCFAVGVDFDCLPVTVSKQLESTDIIFSKGMANFEAFSEKNYRPIVYLLRTKCKPIANAMHVPVHGNILQLIES